MSLAPVVWHIWNGKISSGEINYFQGVVKCTEIVSDLPGKLFSLLSFQALYEIFKKVFISFKIVNLTRGKTGFET